MRKMKLDVYHLARQSSQLFNPEGPTDELHLLAKSSETGLDFRLLQNKALRGKNMLPNEEMIVNSY